MEFHTHHQQDGHCQARVEGEMTIYTAAELHRKLFDLLHQFHALELSLETVTEIDTAGLQLLMLANREAASQDKLFVLVSPSEPVREVQRLLGLDAPIPAMQAR